jgi:hypothetical protein
VKFFAATGTSEYHLTQEQRKCQDVDTEQKLDITHSYCTSHSHPVKHKRYHNGGILSSELLDSSLPVVRDLRECNPHPRVAMDFQTNAACKIPVSLKHWHEHYPLQLQTHNHRTMFIDWVSASRRLYGLKLRSLRTGRLGANCGALPLCVDVSPFPPRSNPWRSILLPI